MELSRQLGVEIYRPEKWREEALAGIHKTLKEREAPVRTESDGTMKGVGGLTMQNELLWQRVKKPGPLVKTRPSK